MSFVAVGFVLTVLPNAAAFVFHIAVISTCEKVILIGSFANGPVQS